MKPKKYLKHMLSWIYEPPCFTASRPTAEPSSTKPTSASVMALRRQGPLYIILIHFLFTFVLWNDMLILIALQYKKCIFLEGFIYNNLHIIKTYISLNVSMTYWCYTSNAGCSYSPYSRHLFVVFYFFIILFFFIDVCMKTQKIIMT